MNLPYCIDRLRAGAEIFPGLLIGVSAEQARWKPSPDKWSLLEVINHLADEERNDFRMRLTLTLSDPSQPWPPIDPLGWITEKKYNERNLQESLEDFLAERRRSIAWLEQLLSPDWEQAYQHPSIGPLRAGDLIASWIAHDLLHIRQMDRLHFEYLRSLTGYDTRYAGQW